MRTTEINGMQITVTTVALDNGHGPVVGLLVTVADATPAVLATAERTDELYQPGWPCEISADGTTLTARVAAPLARKLATMIHEAR